MRGTGRAAHDDGHPERLHVVLDDAGEPGLAHPRAEKTFVPSLREPRPRFQHPRRLLPRDAQSGHERLHGGAGERVGAALHDDVLALHVELGLLRPFEHLERHPVAPLAALVVPA